MLLVAANRALRVCRFTSIRKALHYWARSLKPLSFPMKAEQIIRAVERSKERLGPAYTCLAVALTTEALLTQHGYESVLCVGAKRAEGTFEAHAWIERDGAVVVGGPKEVTLQYTRFPRIPLSL